MPVPSEEELSRMTPDERIKRLRELSDERKKELEATRKKVEEELAAAEQLITRSEEEKDEEEEAIEKAREKIRDLRFSEEENLEERLAKEREQKPQQSSGDLYSRQQPQEMYQSFGERPLDEQLAYVNANMEKLYKERIWTPEQVLQYKQDKEFVERVQQYQLSEQLLEELGTSASIMNRMKYRS